MVVLRTVEIDDSLCRVVDEIKKVKNGTVEVIVQDRKPLRVYRKENIDLTKKEAK